MRNNKTWRPYFLIAPTMISIGLFVIYPLFYLVQLSLWNTNLMNPAKNSFAGLKNYQNLFARNDFWKVLGNTAVYTAAMVVLMLVLALLIALWIQKNARFNAFVQACIFTPHIISILSVAILWTWLLNSDQGLFNSILKALGLRPIKWLQSSNTAMVSIIMVSVWKSLGYYALILISALKAIPVSIYEAAALDNASRAKVFFKITLPMLSPQLFFVLIVLTISSFKVFETVRVMTLGGPNNATSTLVYYIYSNVFQTLRLGIAASAGVVLMVIVSLLTVVYFAFLSRRVYYQ